MEEILKIFTLSVRDGQMIAIGAIVFFVFWQIMQRALFNPFLALFEEREAITSGASSNAKAIIEDAIHIEKEYDEKIAAARVAAISQRLELTNRAKKEAATIVGAAEGEVQQTLSASRQELANLKNRLKKDLSTEVDTLAKQVVERVSRAETYQ